MDIANLQQKHQDALATQATIAKALNELQLDSSKLAEGLESGILLTDVMSGEQIEKREGLMTLWRAAKDDVAVAADQLDAARLEKEADAIPMSAQVEAKNTMVGALEAFSNDKLDGENPYAGEGGRVLEFPQPYIRKGQHGINEVTPYPVFYTKAGELDYVATERFANQLLEGAVTTTSTGLPGSIPLTLLGLFRQAIHHNRIMARCSVRPVPYLKGTYKGSVRTTPNKAVIVAEGADIPEKDPGYSELEISIYKYGAYVEVSFEADNTIQPWSLMGDLEDNLSEAMGIGMAEHHAIGDGSGKPLGIVGSANVSGNQIVEADGAALKTNVTSRWTGISRLWVGLKPAYRSSPSFTIMAASVPFGDIAAMTDETTSNRPMFRWTEDPNIMPIIDGFVANRAVMEVPEMENGAMDYPVVAGDLSRYLVLLAGGLRVEESEHVKFLSDKIVIRALQSSGAKATIPEAFTRVQKTAA